jgi:hypothetical protein
VTDKQDTQGTPFDMAACAAMMEKMVAQVGAGCDCTEIMSRMANQAEAGCCDWSEMMSQIKATCCGVQEETAGDPTAKATQQA